MTMSFNRVDPTDPNSNTAAIQLTSKDIPEEELTLIENELKSEIEKVNKAHQDYNDKKNKVLQSNPPQGPSADYGADMWKLFDVYSRAGQLFALRFYENKLAIVHSELQPCLTQIEEIKKFKQDKENKGEQLSHVEIDDIEQRLNKIKARMEVLANISRKVTGEPDKDLAIPRASYTFGTLEMAQALGDNRALCERGLPVTRLHLRSRQNALTQLRALLTR